MSQEVGILGRLVGKMIERSVRGRFRRVMWRPPAQPVVAPTLYVANHHGWFDGYLMFLLVRRLNTPALDWIEEYDAFPLFSKVGGMPYPRGDAAARAQTIRKTISAVKNESKSLVLFAEGVLHAPPGLLPIGKALDLLLANAPFAQVRPVAIVYRFDIHERPEAFLAVGDALDPSNTNREAIHGALDSLLAKTRETSFDENADFEQLWEGTGDVNERWGFNKGRKYK